MDIAENQPLTEWRMRIRDATTPGELLRIAEELRARSEAAQRALLAETRSAEPELRGSGDKPSRTFRSAEKDRAG